MMHFFDAVYSITLLFCILSGLFVYKRLNASANVIFILVLLAGLTEYTGNVFSFFKINKAPLYHIYSLLEITLMSVFFLMTIKKYKKKYAIICFSFWLTICIINAQCFQPITKFNSYMLITESFVIIIMSLYALYAILSSDVVNVFRDNSFWIWTVVLLFWSGTFFYWAYIELFYKEGIKFIKLITYFQIVINILFYLGIGAVFLRYPGKLKTK
ncbi:MAG: hypothetical protein JWQ38_2556 [Flavipsychrobacter sp.]|nr:hypothetical protein [Flavipsychrobacter sp.]